MARIYLLGGEDVKNRSCYKLNKLILSKVEEPIVLIVPWTTLDPRKERRYRAIYRRYFRDLGARETLFLERSLPPEALAEAIRRADVLYLPGGETETLLKSISEKKLETHIKRFAKIIVGNSAGAHVLGRYCVLDENRVTEGLSLTPFSVYAHYNPRRDAKTLEKLARNKLFFALPENTALEYDTETGKIETHGNVYLFYNPA